MIRLPCFDPTYCLDLGLVFDWEMEGIWTCVPFIEVVAAFVNLLLGFESINSDLYSPSYGLFPGTAIIGCLVVCVQIFGLISVLISYRFWDLFGIIPWSVW